MLMTHANFFMVTDKRNILRSPIEELGLTSNCEAYLSRMEFKCLDEFIKKGWSDLRNHPHFNYIYFNEVVSYLQKNDLLFLMERQNSDL